MKLTDVRIRNAKPRGQTYKLSDGAGMYLLVTKNGARYWRFDYRFNGNRRTLALAFIPRYLFLWRESVERPPENCWPKAKIQTLQSKRQSERQRSQGIIRSRRLHGNGLTSSAGAWHQDTLPYFKLASRPTFFHIWVQVLSRK